jgi:hypothetical protein
MDQKRAGEAMLKSYKVTHTGLSPPSTPTPKISVGESVLADLLRQYQDQLAQLAAELAEERRISGELRLILAENDLPRPVVLVGADDRMECAVQGGEEEEGVLGPGAGVKRRKVEHV